MAGFFMRGRMGGMPRFTLKDAILATTLVAFGATMAYWSINWPNRTEAGWHGVTAFYLWCAAGAAIGAGMLWPFKKSSLGAVIGLVAQLAVLYLLITRGLLI
jgi:hypothetical protein